MNNILPYPLNLIRNNPTMGHESIQLLDGSQGTNREAVKSCQLRVNNDYEAMQCWLNEYKDIDTTYRSYQKEAERLLLWCVIQHKKPLSSLDRDDFESYFAFLEDPQPKHLWCAPRGGKHRKRGEQTWRPFVGPLKAKAKANAITIINSLMTYLVDACYLAFNPLVLIRKRMKKQQSLEAQHIKIYERIIEPDEWEAILESIEEMPTTTPFEIDEKERTRFLVAILFLLGLRVEELEEHTWNSFRKIGDDWWFFLVGKGDKPGMIPVNDELIDHVVRYRTYLKKTPLPTSDDIDPMIKSFRAEKALGARQVNNVIKNIVNDAAKKFSDHPEKAKRLKKVSAHWFRHLSSSMQDSVGIDERYIQENLRHSNLATTRKYIHSRQKDRHNEMQKLRLRPK
jgi:integrase